MDEKIVAPSEFEDTYDLPPAGHIETFTSDLLEVTLEVLKLRKPVCASVDDILDGVIAGMAERNQGCVLITEGEALAGIFTERDLLTRVVGRGLDPKGTALSDVMTPNPEVLSLRDRVAYAVHCMSVAGYRTVPLVDAQHKPVGIVTVSDVIRWLASLFPATVLNLPPGGDRLKRPGQVDSG